MERTFLTVILAIFILTTAASAGPPTVVWNNPFESGGNDQAYGVAADASGNAYVTGHYGDIGTAAACRTIKYDPDGNIVWNKLYDEDVVDAGHAVTVDGAGNVYVAGLVLVGSAPDYLLIKYNANGDQLWVKTWGASGSDEANGVAADISGNVYVTGMSWNGANNDFRTIKYDSEGNLQWGQSYDESGNNDEAQGVSVDASGNVYVAGSTWNGANEDFLTVKYNRDGDFQWSDVRDETHNDWAFDIAVDAGGEVYVGGGSEDDGGTDVDFFAVKYDTDGNFQWKKRYGDNNMNYAEGIAVDHFFVYLTGITSNSVDDDFLTIRYDKEGNFSWEKIFDSGNFDLANDVAVDRFHNIYVAGYCYESSDFDFRTIKYAQDDVPGATEAPPVLPLNLKVVENLSPTPMLSYTIPEGMQGKLTFYSADGRLIESHTLDPVQSTFSWDLQGIPSGVYFVLLESGSASISKKVPVVR